jgi:hypothetical protein
MNDSEPCPFCGGNKIKKLPLSDKVKKANATGAGNGGGIEIESNPDKEYFFKCNGCNLKFVDAERDIVNEFNLNEFNENDKIYLNLVLNGYRGALVHPKKFDILLYLTKMHEALTSTPEFEKIRTTIMDKETEQYITNSDLRNVPMIRAKRV